MSTNRIPFFALSSLLLLAAAAMAQSGSLVSTVTTTVSKGAGHVYGVGDAQVGAQADFAVGMSMTTTRSILAGNLPPSVQTNADASAFARVLFRGDRYTVASAAARADGDSGFLGHNSAWSAAVTVRLFDATIFRRDYAGTTPRTFPLWSMQEQLPLFDIPVAYPLGLGINANVRFAASAGVRGGISLVVDPAATRLGLESSFAAGASGSVSVSLSLLCLEAGLSSTLRLFHGTVSPNMSVSLANGIQGGFDYRFEALRVLADLFWNGCGLISGRLEIYDRTFGVVAGTKTML